MLRIFSAALLFVTFLLPFRAFALPVISLSQLTPGAAFTWSYIELHQDGGSSPYSTERYEVISQNGMLLTIQMSTRLDHLGQKEFKPTHKFIVDYRKCLDAHRDSRQKHNFLIDLFPANRDGTYDSKPILTEGLAFEEKFNCNPQERKGRPDPYTTNYSTETTFKGEARLFQQKRMTADQITGFYFLDDPELAGVLARKDFNPEMLNHFRMQLVEWKRAP
ncbi:MAG: hypothetical protein ACXVBE_03500 [Bdellovibrionota bacterium]